MITNSTGKVCETALKSILAAHDAGFTPLPDTIAEVRLALSLLTDGAPSVTELEPYIGRNWAICRATKRNTARYRNCLTPSAFRKAEIKALAARVGVTEGFVAVRI